MRAHTTVKMSQHDEKTSLVSSNPWDNKFNDAKANQHVALAGNIAVYIIGEQINMSVRQIENILNMGDDKRTADSEIVSVAAKTNGICATSDGRKDTERPRYRTIIPACAHVHSIHHSPLVLISICRYLDKLRFDKVNSCNVRHLLIGADSLN